MFKELRIIHCKIITKYTLASYSCRLQGEVEDEARKDSESQMFSLIKYSGARDFSVYKGDMTFALRELSRGSILISNCDQCNEGNKLLRENNRRNLL